MNANELADWVERQGNGGAGNMHLQTANMLRQQQADYYSLLVNHDKLYAKVVEQQAEIEALKAKTLTDEEIISEWSLTSYDPKTFIWSDDVDSDLIIQFARAILRKAQEG